MSSSTWKVDQGTQEPSDFDDVDVVMSKPAAAGEQGDPGNSCCSTLAPTAKKCVIAVVVSVCALVVIGAILLALRFSSPPWPGPAPVKPILACSAVSECPSANRYYQLSRSGPPFGVFPAKFNSDPESGWNYTTCIPRTRCVDSRCVYDCDMEATCPSLQCSVGFRPVPVVQTGGDLPRQPPTTGNTSLCACEPLVPVQVCSACAKPATATCTVQSTTCNTYAQHCPMKSQDALGWNSPMVLCLTEAERQLHEGFFCGTSPTYICPVAIPGRLFRNEDTDTTVFPVNVDVGQLAAASDSALLAARFTRMAQGEHASVASFSKFTLQLLAVGAPADLVRRSIGAAAEEAVHAELAFALASRFAGQRVKPVSLPAGKHLDVRVVADLRQITLETVHDACINEAMSTLEAARDLQREKDDQIRQFLTVVVRDEAEHMALGFRTVAWALNVQPSLRQEVEHLFLPHHVLLKPLLEWLRDDRRSEDSLQRAVSAVLAA